MQADGFHVFAPHTERMEYVMASRMEHDIYLEENERKRENGYRTLIDVLTEEADAKLKKYMDGTIAHLERQVKEANISHPTIQKILSEAYEMKKNKIIIEETIKRFCDEKYEIFLKDMLAGVNGGESLLPVLDSVVDVHMRLRDAVEKQSHMLKLLQDAGSTRGKIEKAISEYSQLSQSYHAIGEEIKKLEISAREKKPMIAAAERDKMEHGEFINSFSEDPLNQYYIAILSTVSGNDPDEIRKQRNKAFKSTPLELKDPENEGELWRAFSKLSEISAESCRYINSFRAYQRARDQVEDLISKHNKDAEMHQKLAAKTSRLKEDATAKLSEMEKDARELVSAVGKMKKTEEIVLVRA